MLTVIYCAKDKRKQAREALQLEPPYVFASPTDEAVDHSATRVIIVGNHPSIAERYAGLAKVETLDLDQDQESDTQTETKSEDHDSAE